MVDLFFMALFLFEVAPDVFVFDRNVIWVTPTQFEFSLPFVESFFLLNKMTYEGEFRVFYLNGDFQTLGEDVLFGFFPER